MVGDAYVAATFCLQDIYYMVGVCHCGMVVSCNCHTNCKFPGNKSSDCKSGEEFENGVNNLKIRQFENLKMHVAQNRTRENNYKITRIFKMFL